MATKPLSPDEAAETAAAKSLHQALDGVDMSAVPVMTRDRQLPLKDQARFVRALFGQLNLAGISVSVPRYAGARAVHVRLPARSDYVFDDLDFVVDGDVARAANNRALEQVRAVLAAAFPNHDDRSDPREDFHDYRFGVS